MSESAPAIFTATERRPRRLLATAAASPPRLIDPRLVRAELLRLRALRPGTEVPRARFVRSTISGGK